MFLKDSALDDSDVKFLEEGKYCYNHEKNSLFIIHKRF